MSSDWSREVWRLILVVITCGIVGLSLGRPFLVIGLGLTGLVIWHLRWLRRVQRWLDNPDQPPPTEYGVWGDIYAKVRRLQNAQRGRERKLLDDLREFQVSAAAMPDALVRLGPNWEIRWMNGAASRLLGLSPRDDPGQPFVNLYRDPGLAAYLRAGNYDQPLELNARGRSDKKLSIRVIPYADQQHLLVAQDVTSRHRLERVRTDFVANVSHELRTPLTVIGGFVENLQHEESDCARRWARPLKLMAQQTQRMQRIVEDLLLLARLEGGGANREDQGVPVAKMSAELRDVAASARSEHPRIGLEVDASLGLRGDEQQLRSAFQNLVINAVNYTPPDGSVVIRWLAEEGGGARFEVEDTGEGIAPEHIPRLTERFYRVDTGRSREKGGTGLGLAIVKHVIQHHDGQLGIESQLGKGSRFVCRFPASRVIPAEPPAAVRAG